MWSRSNLQTWRMCCCGVIALRSSTKHAYMCESKYTFSASFEGPCGALSLETQNPAFREARSPLSASQRWRASRVDDVVAHGLNSLQTLPRAIEVLGIEHVADVHGDVLAQDASDRCVRLCEKG